MSKLRESQLDFIRQSEKLQSVKSNVPSVNDRLEHLTILKCSRKGFKLWKPKNCNEAVKTDFTQKAYKPNKSTFQLPLVVRYTTNKEGLKIAA
jgi:hypothetical protein